jgi:hypothetical protein
MRFKFEKLEVWELALEYSDLIYIEVIACLHLAKRRKYIKDEVFLEPYDFGEKVFAKLQTLRKSLR